MRYSNTRQVHRHDTCTDFLVKFYDMFLVITLLSAATALMCLGLLALLADAPFNRKSLATGITFVTIASFCIICLASHTIYMQSRRIVYEPYVNQNAIA